MALDRAKRPSGQRKFAVFHDDGCANHHVERYSGWSAALTAPQDREKPTVRMIHTSFLIAVAADLIIDSDTWHSAKVCTHLQ